MTLVAGLDFGGSAVKACVADVERGEVIAVAQQATTTQHPAPGRVEFEPQGWWLAAATAMRVAVARAARPAEAYAAVSATSLRQGYVLLDGTGELGPGVLNADRRGAAHLDRLRRTIGSGPLYETTGHWPAPQLTLPKLLEEQAGGERWAGSTTMLFVHDWALWRLCGERVSEPSLASSGQLLDIAHRTWAFELLEALGLGAERLPPLADSGTIVGTLRDGSLGLPTGIAVVVGGGDTHLAALGAGGLDEGVVSVVAGTTTPLQAATARLALDPQRHPWVSSHLVPRRWAVETNAGYAGMNLDWLARIAGREVLELATEAEATVSGNADLTALVASATWSEEAWSRSSPNLLLGFEPRHSLGQLARAFIEAHAFAIRSNLEDLDRVLGAPAARVRLLGGAGAQPGFAQLVADVLGRPVEQAREPYPSGRAFAWLAARALGLERQPPAFVGSRLEPREGPLHDAGYHRWRNAEATLRASLASWAS